MNPRQCRRQGRGPPPAAPGVAPTSSGYGYRLFAARVAGPVTITILLLGSAEHRLEGSLRGPDEQAAEESRGTSEDDEKDGSPAPAGVTRG